VDLEAGELHLRSAKGDRREVVYLGRAIRDHVARFLAARTTGPLFLGIHGRRISDRHAQRRYREWVQRAGIARASSTHCLRHSFGTNLYRRTGDIFLVQCAMLHRNIASTLVYATGRDDQLRDALAR